MSYFFRNFLFYEIVCVYARIMHSDLLFSVLPVIAIVMNNTLFYIFFVNFYVIKSSAFMLELCINLNYLN